MNEYDSPAVMLSKQKHNETQTVAEDKSISSTEFASNLKKIAYSELDIGPVVGEGSFGIVFSGTWRGVPVAIKQLKERNPLNSISSSPNQYDNLLHEAETIARVCNHAFVIQLIGVTLAPTPCVVTVFYENGSVEDLLIHDKSGCRCDIDSSILLRFAFEASLAVHHLHLEGVVHRDLAARNLLIDENFHIRVSDFGFSRVKEEGASKGYTTSTLGPVRWTAPEAMRRKVFSEWSDVFSFGVVLFELFYQEVPWKESDTIDVVIRVCSGECMPIPSLPSHVYMPESTEGGVGVRELMERCWRFEPRERPHITDVITTLKVLMDHLSSREVWDSSMGMLSGDYIAHENMPLTPTYDLMPSPTFLPPPPPPPPPRRQRQIHPAAQAIRQEQELIPHLLKPPPPDWRRFSETASVADLFDTELRGQLERRKKLGRNGDIMSVFVELEKQRASSLSRRRGDVWEDALPFVTLSGGQQQQAAGERNDEEPILAEEQALAVSELRKIYERKARGETNWIRGTGTESATC